MKNEKSFGRMLRKMCAADSHEVILTEEYWGNISAFGK